MLTEVSNEDGASMPDYTQEIVRAERVRLNSSSRGIDFDTLQTISNPLVHGGHPSNVYSFSRRIPPSPVKYLSQPQRRYDHVQSKTDSGLNDSLLRTQYGLNGKLYRVPLPPGQRVALKKASKRVPPPPAYRTARRSATSNQEEGIGMVELPYGLGAKPRRPAWNEAPLDRKEDPLWFTSAEKSTSLPKSEPHWEEERSRMQPESVAVSTMLATHWLAATAAASGASGWAGRWNETLGASQPSTPSSSRSSSPVPTAAKPPRPRGSHSGDRAPASTTDAYFQEWKRQTRVESWVAARTQRPSSAASARSFMQAPSQRLHPAVERSLLGRTRQSSPRAQATGAEGEHYEAPTHSHNPWSRDAPYQRAFLGPQRDLPITDGIGFNESDEVQEEGTEGLEARDVVVQSPQRQLDRSRRPMPVASGAVRVPLGWQSPRQSTVSSLSEEAAAVLMQHSDAYEREKQRSVQPLNISSLTADLERVETAYGLRPAAERPV